MKYLKLPFQDFILWYLVFIYFLDEALMMYFKIVKFSFIPFHFFEIPASCLVLNFAGKGRI